MEWLREEGVMFRWIAAQLRTGAAGVALIGAIAFVLLPALPASAMETYSRSGYVGSYLGANPGVNQCYDRTYYADHHREISTMGVIYVGRTDAYPNAIQNIYMMPVVQRYNGSQFVDVAPGSWQRATTTTGGIAQFGSSAITTQKDGSWLPAGYYRVRFEFRWYVNGVMVGRVLDRANLAREYGGWARIYTGYCYMA